MKFSFSFQNLLFILICLSLGLFSKSLNAQISDTHKSLYGWFTTGTVGEVTRYKTSPRYGYVEFHDGTRFEGILFVKKRGNQYHKFFIESNVRKLNLEPRQVAHYGLLLKVSDFNGGGTKVHEEEGKNFFPGKITMLNGKVKSGLVAFHNSKKIPKTTPQEYYYSGILFAEDENAYLTHFTAEELDVVIQDVHGKEVSYQYLDGKFATQQAIIASREFRSGTIRLEDDTEMAGLISPDRGGFYCHKVYFQGADGKVTLYKHPRLKEINFNDTGESRCEHSKVYVRKIKETTSYLFYENPFPTTVNHNAGFFTDFLSMAGQAVVSQQVTKVVSRQTGKENAEFNENLDTANEADLEQMDAVLESMINTLDADDPANEEALADLAGKRLAVRMTSHNRAQIEKQGGSGKVHYKREFVLYNKSTDKKTILVRSDFRNQIKMLLMTKSDFILLSKKEQRELCKFDNLDRMLAFLEQ